MFGIHKTFSDNGREYWAVPKWWTAVMMILVSGGLIVAITVLFLVLSLKTRVEEAQVKMNELATFNELVKQRRLANDEMLTRRAEVQQWTYSEACLFAKSQGRLCFQNPQWWADPRKYPLLIGSDGAGTGLFPDESIPLK